VTAQRIQLNLLSVENSGINDSWQGDGSFRQHVILAPFSD
jgi:hypothetical protein